MSERLSKDSDTIDVNISEVLLMACYSRPCDKQLLIETCVNADEINIGCKSVTITQTYVRDADVTDNHGKTTTNKETNKT